MRSLGLITFVAFSFYLIGCASPETKRMRGGGSGADMGNRAKFVQMHEGSIPFENTPKIIPTKHPSLAPASQANDLSRK